MGTGAAYGYTFGRLEEATKTLNHLQQVLGVEQLETLEAGHFDFQQGLRAASNPPTVTSCCPEPQRPLQYEHNLGSSSCFGPETFGDNLSAPPTRQLGDIVLAGET